MEIADLAEALCDQGHSVEVLTIQWERTWPKHFQLREIPVTRVRRSLGGAWGMFRFLRELKQQIHDSELDGLIVYGLNDESWGVIRSLVSHIPMVIRIHWTDANQFFNRQISLRQRSILQRSKKLVIDSLATQTLIDSRLDHELIAWVPSCGAPHSFIRPNLSNQTAARACLSDAHPILVIEPLQPLVVCGSNFQDPAIFALIPAWKRVLDQFPNARLWILGDGPGSNTLWEAICDQELAESIVMPGCFDDLTEVLQAADVYVHAISRGADNYSLWKSMSVGVTPVAIESDDVKTLVKHEQNGLIVSQFGSSPDLADSMANSICLLLADRSKRQQFGSAATKTASEFQISNWIHHFCQPLQRMSLDSVRLSYRDPFSDDSTEDHSTTRS